MRGEMEAAELAHVLVLAPDILIVRNAQWAMGEILQRMTQFMDFQRMKLTRVMGNLEEVCRGDAADGLKRQDVQEHAVFLRFFGRTMEARAALTQMLVSTRDLLYGCSVRLASAATELEQTAEAALKAIEASKIPTITGNTARAMEEAGVSLGGRSTSKVVKLAAPPGKVAQMPLLVELMRGPAERDEAIRRHQVNSELALRRGLDWKTEWGAQEGLSRDVRATTPSPDLAESERRARVKQLENVFALSATALGKMEFSTREQRPQEPDPRAFEGSDQERTFQAWSPGSPNPAGDLASLRLFFVEGFGSVADAWAFLDKERTGSISFLEFRKIEQLGFEGDVSGVFRQLDRRNIGRVSLDDLNPTVFKLRRTLVRYYGSILDAWSNCIDIKGTGKAGASELRDALRRIDLDVDFTTLWEELDPKGRGYITVDDLKTVSLMDTVPDAGVVESATEQRHMHSAYAQRQDAMPSRTGAPDSRPRDAHESSDGVVFQHEESWNRQGLDALFVGNRSSMKPLTSILSDRSKTSPRTERPRVEFADAEQRVHTQDTSFQRREELFPDSVERERDVHGQRVTEAQHSRSVPSTLFMSAREARQERLAKEAQNMFKSTPIRPQKVQFSERSEVISSIDFPQRREEEPIKPFVFSSRSAHVETRNDGLRSFGSEKPSSNLQSRFGGDGSKPFGSADTRRFSGSSTSSRFDRHNEADGLHQLSRDSAASSRHERRQERHVMYGQAEDGAPRSFAGSPRRSQESRSPRTNQQREARKQTSGEQSWSRRDSESRYSFASSPVSSLSYSGSSDFLHKTNVFGARSVDGDSVHSFGGPRDLPRGSEDFGFGSSAHDSVHDVGPSFGGAADASNPFGATPGFFDNGPRYSGDLGFEDWKKRGKPRFADAESKQASHRKAPADQYVGSPRSHDFATRDHIGLEKDSHAEDKDLFVNFDRAVELRRIFDLCDTGNHDNTIDLQELIEATHTRRDVAEFLGFHTKVAWENATREEIAHLFSEFDFNDDKAITWKEFIEFDAGRDLRTHTHHDWHVDTHHGDAGYLRGQDEDLHLHEYQKFFPKQ
eukprot:TRINITY_DN38976_c0_g1_i1.p1 TRINITY_DN38976_c0_g1~~TRINITY_DN38976_c0_g1_i1.p1  ORF type:complete len:1204 (+),score=233.79 TRINITY_DN38976_c0_g1_i1:417-3614(+)